MDLSREDLESGLSTLEGGTLGPVKPGQKARSELCGAVVSVLLIKPNLREQGGTFCRADWERNLLTRQM